ncbi:hypothetical protein F5Y01DRAFT_289386 [Xylaria sp. FL0043]|nr:hypothetical protein F5Y01DRAFT_289386 [Xylaria sp. FL0043]
MADHPHPKYVRNTSALIPLWVCTVWSAGTSISKVHLARQIRGHSDSHPHTSHISIYLPQPIIYSHGSICTLQGIFTSRADQHRSTTKTCCS